MQPEPYAATTIARNMAIRLARTHDKQAIAIFSGAPGIGKSTSLRAFQDANSSSVAIIKLQKKNASATLVMQHVIEALLVLVDGSGRGGHVHAAGAFIVRDMMKRTISRHVRALDIQGELKDSRLTLVFDEAQNLSRAAIEELRFWNDRDGQIGDLPIGLVFVGNAEFSLAADSTGQSTISAAVASRALYQLELDRDDLTDEDFGLVLEAHGIIDANARASALRTFRTSNTVRDLRGLVRLVDELRDRAATRPAMAIA